MDRGSARRIRERLPPAQLGVLHRLQELESRGGWDPGGEFHLIETDAGTVVIRGAVQETVDAPIPVFLGLSRGDLIGLRRRGSSRSRVCWLTAAGYAVIAAGEGDR